MSFSIFIASRTRTVSPFFTAWPAAAFTATIFPGIGAVTLTEPAAPAGAAGAGAGAAAGAGAGAGTGAAGAGAAANAARAAAPTARPRRSDLRYGLSYKAPLRELFFSSACLSLSSVFPESAALPGLRACSGPGGAFRRVGRSACALFGRLSGFECKICYFD